ncbi:hypothetical protein FOM02_19485 [Bradyrhizobium sp. SEMIA]|nr:hypothetical protein FOM02_19485 [Bradyrhizobium sp. SEMIA]
MAPPNDDYDPATADEAEATEDELAAERAVAKATTVRGFPRQRGERQTLEGYA